MTDIFEAEIQCISSLELHKHEVALIVAAKAIQRYKGSRYEPAAVAIFERIEAAHANLIVREQTHQRAMALLERKAP